MTKPFTLYLGHEVLGYSQLEDLDEGMGVASGIFTPTAKYETVQPVFRRFAAALGHHSAEATDEVAVANYYRERDALPLSLVNPAGLKVSTSFIHVEDLSVEALSEAEALRLVAQISDREAYRG